MNSRDFVRQVDLDGLACSTDWSERLHIDFVLLGFLLLLGGAGLFFLYSATGGDMAIVMRQAAYFGVSFALMFTIAQIEPRTLEGLAKWFYLFGLLLLLIVLFLGFTQKGHNVGFSYRGFAFSLLK